MDPERIWYDFGLPARCKDYQITYVLDGDEVIETRILCKDCVPVVDGLAILEVVIK